MQKLLFARRYSDDPDFRRSPGDKPAVRILRMLVSFGLIIGIMALATLISVMFRNLGFHESNYIMTYNLGVVLIAYLTEGYLYGVIASLLGMLTFNYFFTEPYYTLIAYSPEYPVTFIIGKNAPDPVPTGKKPAGSQQLAPIVESGLQGHRRLV